MSFMGGFVTPFLTSTCGIFSWQKTEDRIYQHDVYLFVVVLYSVYSRKKKQMCICIRLCIGNKVEVLSIHNK